MAQRKLIIAFFFLAIILSLQNIQTAEGRKLKFNKNKEFTTIPNIQYKEDSRNFHSNEMAELTPPPTLASPVASQPQTPSPPSPGHAEDYRHTTPGNSPGIGHSRNLQRISNIQSKEDSRNFHSNEMAALTPPPTPASPMASQPQTPSPPIPGHAEDYRHTTPGNSPGIGHSRNLQRIPNIQSKEDSRNFRSNEMAALTPPPTPASPMASQPQTPSPPIPGHAEGYRHTTPGNSPGIGHSRNLQRIPNIQSKEDSRNFHSNEMAALTPPPTPPSSVASQPQPPSPPSPGHDI